MNVWSGVVVAFVVVVNPQSHKAARFSHCS